MLENKFINQLWYQGLLLWVNMALIIYSVIFNECTALFKTTD